MIGVHAALVITAVPSAFTENDGLVLKPSVVVRFRFRWIYDILHL